MEGEAEQREDASLKDDQHAQAPPGKESGPMATRG